jgi:hypothetical protein
MGYQVVVKGRTGRLNAGSGSWILGRPAWFPGGARGHRGGDVEALERDLDTLERLG